MLVLDHVVEEVGHVQIGLVAGGDHVGEAEARRLAAIEQREADAAGLRDHADAASDDQDAVGVFLHFDGRAERGGDAAERVEVALAVRAAGADAGALRHLDESRLHVAGGAALLGETRS